LCLLMLMVFLPHVKQPGLPDACRSCKMTPQVLTMTLKECGMSGLMRTSACPVGFRCESCGTATGPLAVHARSVSRGIACLTLCRACCVCGLPPPVSAATAERLVREHRGHLGA
jgi:hypothetical protein